MAVMYQQTYAPIPPLQVEGETDTYGDELTKIVMQAIAKDPQDRFPDVQAFADALKFGVFLDSVMRMFLIHAMDGIIEDWLSTSDAEQSARDYLELAPSFKDEKAILEGLTILGKKYKHAELTYLDASKGCEELLRQVDELKPSQESPGVDES